jgi:transposase
MAKRSKQTQRRKATPGVGNLARSDQGTLRSYTVGALPILNRLLDRMKLEEILQAYLPAEDRRTKVPTARGLVLLVKNILISREPIYGLGEWAARYAPDLLGLEPEQVLAINDDRAGRWLGKLFACDPASPALAVAAHCVQEFGVSLDELHNDSTTVTFHGAYPDAREEKQRRGRNTLAITFGHNKDHRPDLKQLLYILTLSQDGGVPVHFRAKSGNVVDDQTHRDTWQILCRLAGRPDFLYVADCKLATAENMTFIHGHGGRFLTVLPRTRKEDDEFRASLLAQQVRWRPLWDKTDDQGKLVDRFSVADPPTLTAEGYRLVWFHSIRKAELDAAARATNLQRALKELAQLREKLHSPRTRYRQKAKVHEAVQAILEARGASTWIRVQVEEVAIPTYRQARRGRPGKNTPYLKKVATRFDLNYSIDHEQIAADASSDGVFPLVSNDRTLSELELLHAYKRQPLIEKRFSQMKTDFQVAPVWLKDVGRIEALLGVYFFALLAEALLERQLRKAMEREGIEALPMYPEGRPCRRPTARRLIDLFEPIQRHRLHQPGQPATILVTDLSPLHRRLLRLLGLPATTYGR